MKIRILALLLLVFTAMSFNTLAEINLDFSTATDDELVQALDAIKAEQRSRLKTKIVLSETEILLAKGKTKKLSPSVIDMEEGVKAGKFTWSTSDKTIASCSNGTVTAVKPGTAVITCFVTLSDGTELEEDCTVEVYVPVASVKMSTKRYKLKAGDAITPEFTISPKDATNPELEMTSKNPEIAYIDSDGDVVALGAGETTITAMTIDGSEKSVSFTVVVETADEQMAAASSNTKKEAISKKLRDGKYIIGKDIPAGKYLITCLETEGERIGGAYSSLGSAYDALDDSSDGNWSSLFSSLGNMMGDLSEMEVEILGDYGDVLRSVSMKAGDTVELKLEEKTALQISEGSCTIESID
ncbi:MAG: Ig-like domain-containing protein [Clostridia bacterium]|nr:Ig-like domain-containing protein [Clostridia bacterium]